MTSLSPPPAAKVPQAAGTSSALAVVDGVHVDAVAAAVQRCPGVAGLDAGRFGEVGSYLPGRTVPGVRVDAAVTIQVRGRWGVPAADLLTQIRAATARLLAAKPLIVVLADIDDPPTEPAAAPLAPPNSSTVAAPPTSSTVAAPMPTPSSGATAAEPPIGRSPAGRIRHFFRQPE